MGFPEPRFEVSPAVTAAEARRQRGVLSAVICIVWPFVAALLLEHWSLLQQPWPAIGFLSSAVLLQLASVYLAAHHLKP